ncbi:hypothetical protein HDZ31DRAFT_82753 [Schizophyllum fasciatum]
MTAYSYCDSARIQSSPLAPDYKSLARETTPTRRGRASATRVGADKITLPSFRTMFGGDDLPPLTSSSTSSGYYADDSTISADEASEGGDGPGYDSVFFSDEEEADSDGGDVYEDVITGLSYRRTSYFQTSAERGRWKYEPVVPRSSHQPRKSEPSIVTSDISSPTAFTRPASEPAPATVAPSPFMSASESASVMDPDMSPPSPAADSSVAAFTPPQDPSPEEPDEIDDPMPPTSPLLSPTSPSLEDENEPVSPLSLSNQTDAEPITSTVSCEGTMVVDFELKTIVNASSAMESPDLHAEPQAVPESASTEQDSKDDGSDNERVTLPQQPLRPSAPCQSSPAASKTVVDGPPKVLAGDKENHAHDVLSNPAKRTKSRSPVLPCDASITSHALTPPPVERPEQVDEPAPIAKTDSRMTEEPSNEAVSSSEKRKTDDADPGPARKRSRQTLSPAPERPSSPLSEEEDVRPPPKKSAKARSRKRSTKPARDLSVAATSDAEGDEPMPKPQRPARKRRTTLEKLSDTTFADQPSLPPSTYRRAKPPPPPTEPAGPSPDDEVRGMLIQSMAASRASSQTLTTLSRAVLEAYPHLLEKQPEDEWHSEFAGVLERGATQAGLFGKVESSYQGNGVEAQWFYVPERDPDQERASLIKMMFPRLAKRSETKKYKQYYYAPLARINKWDPEDAL